MTRALAIRDAVLAHVEALGVFAEVKKTTAWQRQPDKLPSAHVLFLSEEGVNSDFNMGEVGFSGSVSIGISVGIKAGDDTDLDSTLDLYWDAIRNRIFVDPLLIGHAEGSLSEGVSRVNRTHVYPQEGETFYAEGRFELTFQTPFDVFTPESVDLNIIHETIRPINHPLSPNIERIIVPQQPQDPTLDFQESDMSGTAPYSIRS